MLTRCPPHRLELKKFLDFTPVDFRLSNHLLPPESELRTSHGEPRYFVWTSDLATLNHLSSLLPRISVWRLRCVPEGYYLVEKSGIRCSFSD